jgi:DNA-binding beta-propeller fold protein YncE
MNIWSSVQAIFLAGFVSLFFLNPSLVEAKPHLKKIKADSVTQRAPVRIALTSNRDLLVSDYQQQMILRMDGVNLAIHEAFRAEGRPLAIATDSEGRLYIGNETHQSVEVYDPKGRYLYELGFAQGIVKVPNDMAIDASRGLVFVVDSQEKNVKVFDTQGPFRSTISGPGPAPYQLAHPTGIALDEGRREVLVSDYGDPEGGIPPRIQIYDYSGNYLGTISGEDRFSRPQGLAVDGSGRIFLVDCLLGQVLAFDRHTGALLKTLGSFGSDPGQLFLPLDLVLDDVSKDVFVTNNRPGRVEVFRGGGRLP